MRCLTCNGRGWVENEADNRAQLPLIPCPRCQGTGIDHCCDGDLAAIEVVDDVANQGQPPPSGERNSART
jgi:hypothetical protein